MRPLPPIGHPFKVRGEPRWTFVILEREGDVVLLKKAHPEVREAHFEVAIVQRHEGFKVGDAFVEAAECLPGAEKFGQLAWALRSDLAARIVFADKASVQRRLHERPKGSHAG